MQAVGGGDPQQQGGQSPRIVSAAAGALAIKRSASSGTPVPGRQAVEAAVKEQQAFYDAARCLLIGCLERSRRMDKLNASQVRAS